MFMWKFTAIVCFCLIIELWVLIFIWVSWLINVILDMGYWDFVILFICWWIICSSCCTPFGLLGNLFWLALELRVEIRSLGSKINFFFFFCSLFVYCPPFIYLFIYFVHLVSEFFLEKYSIVICRFRSGYLMQKLFWVVYVLCCRLSHEVIGWLVGHGDDSWIEIWSCNMI